MTVGEGKAARLVTELILTVTESQEPLETPRDYHPPLLHPGTLGLSVLCDRLTQKLSFLLVFSQEVSSHPGGRSQVW